MRIRLLALLTALAAAARADAPTAQYQVLNTGTDHATVWDQRAGLEWTQTPSCVGSSALPGCTWAQALAACATLDNAAGFAGHTDWRLASIKELQTLVDRRGYYWYYGQPVVDYASFPGQPTGVPGTGGAPPTIDYWSSTPSAGDPASAWFVDFALGTAQAQTQTALGYARCARTHLNPT